MGNLEDSLELIKELIQLYGQVRDEIAPIFNPQHTMAFIRAAVNEKLGRRAELLKEMKRWSQL